MEKSNDCGNEQWTWKRAMVAEKSNDLFIGDDCLLLHKKGFLDVFGGW